jgi:hypothetical protein
MRRVILCLLAFVFFLPQSTLLADTLSKPDSGAPSASLPPQAIAQPQSMPQMTSAQKEMQALMTLVKRGEDRSNKTINSLRKQPKPNPKQAPLDAVKKPIKYFKMASHDPQESTAYEAVSSTDSLGQPLDRAHHAPLAQEQIVSAPHALANAQNAIDPAALHRISQHLAHKKEDMHQVHRRLNTMEKDLGDIKMMLKSRPPVREKAAGLSINWPPLIPFALALLIAFFAYLVFRDKKLDKTAVKAGEAQAVQPLNDQGEYDFLGSKEGQQAQLDLLRAYCEMKDAAAVARVIKTLHEAGDADLIQEANAIVNEYEQEGQAEEKSQKED